MGNIFVDWHQRNHILLHISKLYYSKNNEKVVIDIAKKLFQSLGAYKCEYERDDNYAMGHRLFNNSLITYTTTEKGLSYFLFTEQLLIMTIFL